MRKIEYVVSNERLITPSGLSLVGQVLGKSNLIKKANRMRTEKRSQPQIKNGDILLTMIGLLALGKSDFENANEFHTDEVFYKNSLGIAYGIPSESSLRNRLDGIGVSMNREILDGNVDMFLSCKYEPSALQNGCVPVDIDVSPFDNSGSHKAGVSRTYKNFDGYAPIFAYIGTEGYLCNAELREGKQYCQSGTPEFLAETITAAKQMTKKPLLFRMDSGNDALENMLLLHWHDPQLKFLIKHIWTAWMLICAEKQNLAGISVWMKTGSSAAWALLKTTSITGRIYPRISVQCTPKKSTGIRESQEIS